MIKVSLSQERGAIIVETEFYCNEQYLAEVTALLHAITRTTRDKELFIKAVTDRLNEIKKELEEEQKDDKNDTCN